MSLDEIIESKISLIERETGNKVRKKVNNQKNSDAEIDWPNWQGNERKQLPWIIHKAEINRMHLLHELIHLEKTFLNQYSLVSTNNSQQAQHIMDFYKNIPEDYVAHKIIYHVHGINPIDVRWFGRKFTTRNSTIKIATDLVRFYTYLEFRPINKKRYDSIFTNVRRSKKKAHRLACTAIESLESIDINDKSSYDKCADDMIKIFSPNYYGTPEEPNKIYTAFIIKKDGQWDYNR